MARRLLVAFISSIFFVFLLLQSQTRAQQEQQPNYCLEDLCPGNKTHVACNSTAKPGPDCTDNARLLPISNRLRAQILGRHNTIRNSVARGAVRGFQPAARMATMIWSPELASIAEHTVMHCALRHDECRSTERFPYAGQNLAMTYWKNQNFNVSEIVIRQIDRWYDEHLSTTMDVIANFTMPTNGQRIGHFTQLIQERARAVGCAVARDRRSDRVYQYMTCNYAYTNVLGQPIYRVGIAGGSGCRTGLDKNFNALCSIEEVYALDSLQ